MLEPISAALAGLATTKVLENLAGDCLYDVLKFGTAETGAALRQLVQERQQSGEIPTNHTLERGLRRAAVSASLAVVKPISSDALAHMFLAENRDTRPLEAVAEHLRRGLKAATGELEVLQRLYRHQDWDTPRRQARLKAHLAQSVSRPQTVRADADDIENVISRIAGTSDPTTPETPAAQALATIMLNVVIDACRLPHDLGEHVRAALTPRFAGDGADWGELFPLFFAQEMKDDPALHVILVQQRLSWNAEAVASLKDNLEAFRKEARAQANELMHQQLAASRRLETLIRNDARRSRQLSEILSIAWLLDARGRATFQDMFRTPENAVARPADGSESAVQFHYSERGDEFLGREEKLRRIEEEFLDIPETLRVPTDAFRWMAICGEAGTGKSRLAQEIIQRNLDRFRLAGFASDELLRNHRFARENQERITAPVLIVIDYTVGYQEKIPEFMKGWVDYAREALRRGGPPVRIILLLRRFDDRILDDIRSLGGNMADGLLLQGERFGKDDPMRLQHLTETETLALMRARIRQTAEAHDEDEVDASNDTALLETLKRYDKEMRPLFAIMVAYAMQRGTLENAENGEDQESARFQLFSSYLKGQWRNYWRSRAASAGTSLEAADEIVTVHANLLRICTACGERKREDIERFLKSLAREDDDLCELLPSAKRRGEHAIRDRLVVSMAGGRGEMKGDMLVTFPTLEPDLIGECFLLMSWSDVDASNRMWCETDEIVEVAWGIDPDRTGNFLRLMALDYPRRMHAANWFPVPLDDLHAARVRARLLRNISRDTSHHARSEWIDVDAMSRMFDLADRFEEELGTYIDEDAEIRGHYGQMLSRLSEVAANVVNPNLIVEDINADENAETEDREPAISRRFSGLAGNSEDTPPGAFTPPPDDVIALVVERLPGLMERAKPHVFCDAPLVERSPFYEVVRNVLVSAYWAKRDDRDAGGYWPEPRTEDEAETLAAFRAELLDRLRPETESADLTMISGLLVAITYAEWDTRLEDYHEISRQIAEVIERFETLKPVRARYFLNYYANFLVSLHKALEGDEKPDIRDDLALVDRVFLMIVSRIDFDGETSDKDRRHYLGSALDMIFGRGFETLNDLLPLPDEIVDTVLRQTADHLQALTLSVKVLSGLTQSLVLLPEEKDQTEEQRTRHREILRIFSQILDGGQLEGDTFRIPSFSNLGYLLNAWVFGRVSPNVRIQEAQVDTLIDLLERNVGERARSSLLGLQSDMSEPLWPVRVPGPMSRYVQMLAARDGMSDSLANATATVWAELLLAERWEQVLAEIETFLPTASPIGAEGLRKAALAYRGVALAGGFVAAPVMLERFKGRLARALPLGRAGIARLYRNGTDRKDAHALIDTHDVALTDARAALVRLDVLSGGDPADWIQAEEPRP